MAGGWVLLAGWVLLLVLVGGSARTAIARARARTRVATDGRRAGRLASWHRDLAQ